MKSECDVLTRVAKAEKEMILAVPVDKLNCYLRGKTGCIRLDDSSHNPCGMLDFIKFLDRNYIYKSRVLLETDPEYKQIIPYIILKINGKYLNYSRAKQAGDIRLHHKRSIGVGGHINILDYIESNRTDNGLPGVFNVINGAMDRELMEELSTDFISDYELDTGRIYLINMDGDDVSRHHLGIVYVAELYEWDLDDEIISDNFAESEAMRQNIMKMSNLTDTKFTPLRDMNPDSYELWSEEIIKELLETGE